MKKILIVLLCNVSTPFQAKGAGSELMCWIRTAEKQLCDDPRQCQRYLSLTAKGKAVVLQELLRRSEDRRSVSEIQLINWVLKQYQ